MEWALSFGLSAPASIEIKSEVADVNITGTLGNQELVARIRSGGTENEITNQALMVITDLLNTIAWTHNVVLDVNPVPLRSEHIRDDGTRHVGLTLQASIVASGRIIIDKRDEHGQPIEISDSARPGKISVLKSEAAPYFRRGKLSKDPFDRFRNFYLVAEKVGDRIRCAKGIGKLKEEQLLELALQESFTTGQSTLLGMAQGIAVFQSTGNIYKDIARTLYRGFRCQLNHAKTLNDHKIPYNLDDEREVQDASPLMEFIAKRLLYYESERLSANP